MYENDILCIHMKMQLKQNFFKIFIDVSRHNDIFIVRSQEHG